jgi:hypothetical protein
VKQHILLGTLLLAGCAASEAKEAEQQYDIVSNGDDETAKCAAARAVQRAWLNAENEAKYAHWTSLARSHCYLAEVRGHSGGLLTDPTIEGLDMGAPTPSTHDATKIDQSASENSIDGAE